MGQVDETSGVLWAELLVDFVLRDWPKDQFHHAVLASKQPVQLSMLTDRPGGANRCSERKTCR